VRVRVREEITLGAGFVLFFGRFPIDLFTLWVSGGARHSDDFARSLAST
jgi:hypothetical protein